MDIKMKLEPHGWLDIEIESDQEERIEIPVSWLSDALGDMASRLVALHKGAEEVVMVMQTEPGEFRFRIKKTAQARVRFMVYKMHDNFSSQMVTEGALLMSEELTLVKLTKLFYREFSKIRELGLEEYKTRWSYEFPNDAYARIGRVVQIK
ncbi:hypothetical protein [Paenibacillus sp. TSA_86.1]|uniref:hypothetical protein n=1 Tax=Paenibacillus sp. TSA_86.1 TaxID=3415649 RepID=UPI0040459A01